MTRQELAFRDTMARHGDSTYAAAKAGYRDPAGIASKIMARPGMREAVKERESAIWANELLPKSTVALDRALSFLVPNGVTMKAVDIVTKHVFGDQEAGSGKSPSEMTPAELGAALDRLRREQAERATPIIDVEIEEHIPKQGVFD